jgi:predicted DCC family thiol-disulfide oxidoreductase YuxK
MVLIEGGRCYTRSAAALRIARRLSAPWPMLYVFMMVPAFARDAAYDCVARNRYRWFGRTDACRVPTPELMERFLDRDASST